MNRYKAISTICQSIFFLLFIWIATLQIVSAQLRYKNINEPSLPEKYIHLKKGDTLSIHQMLKVGIPVDAIDERGRTLFMQKAFEGDTVCLKYLIKAGADINKSHRSGDVSEYLYTALDYAIIGKQKKTIDFLRRNGALWEEERQKTYSTIRKLDDTIDANMLDYILTKGARLGESEKFRLLIKYVTMPPNVYMQREIVQICLRDTLEITPQKVQSYLNKWETLNAQEVSDRIIKLQEKEIKLRDLSRRKVEIQDSLQRLMAEGKEDTLHYTYYTYADGKIDVSPRIDTFYNKVGDDKDWLVILVSALMPFLLIARLVRKYMKEVWKQHTSKLFFPIGGMWFAIGALFYLPLSTLYWNFDDYCTRLRGHGYTAVADYRLETIKVRNGRAGYHYETVRRYTFTFVTDKGVTTCLNLGLSNFTKYNHTEQGEKISVKYLPHAHKLSIADASNTSDNLLAMGVSSIIIMLMVALLMGKLNFIYKFWKKFRERKSQKKSKRR